MNSEVRKLGYKLKVILDQEVGLLEKLLEVMTQENQLLSKPDTKTLYELSKTKEILILQHAYLDRNRRTTTQSLAKNLNLEPAKPTLADFFNSIEGKLSGLLRVLHEKMQSLIRSIQDLGEKNAFLIRCSIQAVRDSWTLLRQQFVELESHERITGREDSPLIGNEVSPDQLEKLY